ncbi:MAG TPA: ribosomal protein S18-alanine N-acetyltransferase [Candidatus Hydrogenedentes bacterium]|nr:ribosomal protein S18-alanine N-acetyltransferase [Candidatus Hydrogenedentota bacterium]HQM50347.1 ribosomal protein S18-alanine N-acetyltransferase [Candidatus Hydrogenedentota bacterium]
MSAPNTARPVFLRLAEKYLDEIMDIEVEAYPEPWSRNMFYDELRNNRSYFYVMVLGRQVVGYGGFWLVLDEAHITSVTVRDTFRGLGLGRELTQYLVDIAGQAGARIATLEVRESNIRARTLYETFGFRQIARRKGYYPRSGEDAIVMLLELGKGPQPGRTAGRESGNEIR